MSRRGNKGSSLIPSSNSLLLTGKPSLSTFVSSTDRMMEKLEEQKASEIKKENSSFIDDFYSRKSGQQSAKNEFDELLENDNDFFNDPKPPKKSNESPSRFSSQSPLNNTFRSGLGGQSRSPAGFGGDILDQVSKGQGILSEKREKMEEVTFGGSLDGDDDIFSQSVYVPSAPGRPNPGFSEESSPDASGPPPRSGSRRRRAGALGKSLVPSQETKKTNENPVASMVKLENFNSESMEHQRPNTTGESSENSLLPSSGGLRATAGSKGQLSVIINEKINTEHRELKETHSESKNELEKVSFHSDVLFEKFQKLLNNQEKTDSRVKKENKRLEEELKACRSRIIEQEEHYHKLLKEKDEELKELKSEQKLEKEKIIESLKKCHVEETNAKSKIQNYEKERLNEILSIQEKTLKEKEENEERLKQENDRLRREIEEIKSKEKADTHFDFHHKKMAENESLVRLEMIEKKIEMERKALEHEREKLNEALSSLAKREELLRSELQEEKSALRSEREKMHQEFSIARQEEAQKKGEFLKEKLKTEQLKLKYKRKEAEASEGLKRKEEELMSREKTVEGMEKAILEQQRAIDEEIKKTREELERQRRDLNETEIKQRKAQRDIDLSQLELARALDDINSKEEMMKIRQDELMREKSTLHELSLKIQGEMEQVNAHRRTYQTDLERLVNLKLELGIKASSIENDRYRLEAEKTSINGIQKALNVLRTEYLKDLAFNTVNDSQTTKMPIQKLNENHLLRPKDENQLGFKKISNEKPTHSTDIRPHRPASAPRGCRQSAGSFIREYESQLRSYNQQIRATHCYNQARQIESINF